MPRGELHRSGFISMGDHAPPNAVDEPRSPSPETIGPVPEENRPGHRPTGEDPDKPLSKFQKRFPADGRRRRRARSQRTGNGRRSPLDDQVDELRQQRRAALAEVREVDTERLWRPASDGGRSAGEWLEHLARATRRQRLVLAVWLPAAGAIARRRSPRSPGARAPRTAGRKGLRAGPRALRRRANPLITAVELETRLERETQGLCEVLARLDAEMAPRVRVWGAGVRTVDLPAALAEALRREQVALEAVRHAVGLPSGWESSGG